MDREFHFIGIGGIGMSGLARILLDKKMRVSGSDLSLSSNTEQLKDRGAVILQGHSAKHISPKHTVVYSSGIKKTNPEYIAAEALKCQMLHRSELLAELMQGHRCFVCTGTHGKTTTTGLLSYVLTEGEFDPSFAVGGMLAGVNGKIGSGGFFVAEGDESDGSFLDYTPEGAIVTNVEPEHMEYFHDVETLYAAFDRFFEQVSDYDLNFYCGDDAELVKIAKNRGVSYGFSDHCALQVSRYRQQGWMSIFDLDFEGKKYQDVQLNLAGAHNALNAAAVFGLALRLGVEESKIRHALAAFPGIGRRCQKRREELGVLYLDDYAHHPTEIEKTIGAVKHAMEERRLVVLFQPHRFTRTRDTLKITGKAFEMADEVYITDIYTAGEDPIEGITPERIVEEIAAVSTVPVSYLPKDKWQEIPLHPHDVFLSLGAGDITYVHDAPPLPRKKTLGLVFGGVSCEHEISLRSARFVSEALDRSLYNVHYFGIDKEGKWISGTEAKEILENRAVVSSENCCSIFEMVNAFKECDLFVPILHGTYGEDGTIQGFFEMLGKPYVGPDHRSAALAMDKVLTKRVVASAGVPTPYDFSFNFSEWLEKRQALISQVKKFPVYVKPVHLGSSVGISCVESAAELDTAVENAFRYDSKVMVEEAVLGCRELEFAVLGNDRPVAPPPGEKLAEGCFVDYEKKYSTNSVKTTVTPDLDPELVKKGQELAVKAYASVGCSGLTRVDFLLDAQGTFWFFEMNSIPGLQQFSLFPKIWNREGINLENLLNRLVVLALERKRQQDRHFRCLANS